MSKRTIPLLDYTTDNTALHEQVILVTGASDGLGRALALELATNGATVILSGKTVSKLEAVYDEIENAGGPQPAILPLNQETAEEPEFQTLAHAIADNFGKLDGLVLNAAVLGQHSPVANMDYAQWARGLQVNLTANFLFLKHCSGILNAARRASVVYVSDAIAHQGKAYWASYSAGKAACLNLLQTVADEWETNTEIHVNSIDPGSLLTNLYRQVFPTAAPGEQPEPQTAVKPFLYLLDPGINWPRGKHFSWDLATQNLTEY